MNDLLDRLLIRGEDSEEFNVEVIIDNNTCESLRRFRIASWTLRLRTGTPGLPSFQGLWATPGEILNVPLTGANTFVLICSSVSVVIAHWALEKANVKLAVQMIGITLALGTVFLVGALSYARAPDRRAQGSLAWMSGLLVLSTLDAALGLRALVRLRLRRKFAWVWMATTAAWGLLSIVLVAVLLRG